MSIFQLVEYTANNSDCKMPENYIKRCNSSRVEEFLKQAEYYEKSH